MSNFVNLHLHTEYSIMDSVIKIPQLFKKIEEYNQPAVAITDHASLAGWNDFQKAASDSSVKPIFGCEFYCKPTYDKPSDRSRYHLVVLAKNDNGLKKLRALQRLTIKHRYYKLLLPYPALFNNPDDLFISTACSLGTVGQSLDPTNKHYNPSNAEVFINKLFDTFGKNNVACEFQFHPTYINNNIHVQNKINENLFKICENVQPKYMIATCDSHFLDSTDRHMRTQLKADEWKKQVKDVEESLKSNCVGNRNLIMDFAQESNFPYMDEVPKMLDDTVKIANNLNASVELNYGKVIPKFQKHRELKKIFMKGRKQVMK